MGLDANEVCVCGGAPESRESAGEHECGCAGGRGWVAGMRCLQTPQKFLEPPQYSDFPGETRPPPWGLRTRSEGGQDRLLPQLCACVAVQMAFI